MKPFCASSYAKIELIILHSDNFIQLASNKQIHVMK